MLCDGGRVKGCVMERVEYDEFGLFHENAEEFGLPYDGPPTVRREFVELPDGRKLSASVREAYEKAVGDLAAPRAAATPVTKKKKK